MSYKLRFLPQALKEWKKLGKTVQSQFKKRLAERLENPKVEADKLSGTDNNYKIKLRSAGYRLVYHIHQGELIVTVLAVGKRERAEVYSKAQNRLNSL